MSKSKNSFGDIKTNPLLSLIQNFGFLIGTSAPQMDAEKAQAMTKLDASHKALHYYGETARTYTRKQFPVDAICYYTNNEKHENNLADVLVFLQEREIGYALQKGDLYVFIDNEPSEVTDETFILFRKSESPIFKDIVNLADCVSVLRSLELPEDAELHPDDFSLAEEEPHSGNEG